MSFIKFEKTFSLDGLEEWPESTQYKHVTIENYKRNQWTCFKRNLVIKELELYTHTQVCKIQTNKSFKLGKVESWDGGVVEDNTGSQLNDWEIKMNTFII